MGMLYKQKGSTKWWMKYYINGNPVRESTSTEKEKEAERILKEREGRAAVGRPILPRAERVRVEELLNDLRAQYQTTGRRKLKDADTLFVPLRAFFTGRRGVTLNGAAFTEYIQRRQAAGLANNTINNELSILGTALRLGEENGKVLRLPRIHKLKQANPRQGFFERSQFEAVRKRLPADLQIAVTIFYTFGWRLDEVMGLTLSQVDLEAGTLRLEPGSTKNEEGRIVYLTPELKPLLAAQFDRVKTLSRKLGRVIPFVFPHLRGCYKGQQRRTFYTVWRDACTKAGCPGLLIHDFRRTAVRNMERAAVPRSVAMKVTGHKTESVYRRYAIVADADLQEATRRIHGHSSGHSAHVCVDSPPLSVQNR